MSDKIFFNNDWLFTDSFEESYVAEDCDTAAFTKVRIPHTVKVTPFNYFDESEYACVSAYRKEFTAPADWKGRSVRLTFEGVAHEAKLFVNGKPVFTHCCGYTAFTADLSDILRFGEKNVIAVRVDSNETLNKPPFGFVIDYMTYGGIYRDVYLELSDDVYFEDLFLQARRPEDHPILATDVTLGGAVEGKNLKIRVFRMEDQMEQVSLGEYPVSGRQITVVYHELKRNVAGWRNRL